MTEFEALLYLLYASRFFFYFCHKLSLSPFWPFWTNDNDVRCSHVFAVSPTSPATVGGIVRKDKSSSCSSTTFRSCAVGEKRSKSFDLPPIGESKTENHFTSSSYHPKKNGNKKSFGQHLKKSKKFFMKCRRE